MNQFLGSLGNRGVRFFEKLQASFLVLGGDDRRRNEKSLDGRLYHQKAMRFGLSSFSTYIILYSKHFRMWWLVVTSSTPLKRVVM
jgi:hypothetical protein